MNNNDRKDFFYGAGLDENNNQGMMNNNGMGMNQQSMMNNNMGMNQQPMMNNNMGMNQQPMMGMNQQPMANNNMGMNQQPMMNNNMGMNQQPMMNNNMGMNQQPVMNNGMGMNQQPMMNNGMGMNQPPQNNMGGYNIPSSGGSKFNIGGLLKDKRIIGVAVGIVAVVFILVFFVFHKTLSCTAEEEMAGIKMEMTQSVEYWFGKPTKLKSKSIVDLSDVDEEQREAMIEYYEEAEEDADEDQNLKVKVSGDKVIITSSEKIDEDDMDDYDDAKESAEDAGFTCK